MRFTILGPRTDAATAEQVRAAREARGWTVEQMADAVGAAPLEVSAWEAGTVAAPPLQAAQVQWMLATDRWNAKTGGIPSLSGEPPPPEPDAARFDTRRARYDRWVQRLPRWARGPFNLLGEYWIAVVVLAGVVTMPDPGLPARITGVGMGTLVWIVGFGAAFASLRERFPRYPFGAGFLAGAAALLPAMWAWNTFDPAVPQEDPLLWAGAAAVSVAAGVWSSLRKEPAEASAAEPAPAQPGLAPSAAPHRLPGAGVPEIDEPPPPRAELVPDRRRSR